MLLKVFVLVQLLVCLTWSAPIKETEEPYTGKPTKDWRDFLTTLKPSATKRVSNAKVSEKTTEKLEQPTDKVTAGFETNKPTPGFETNKPTPGFDDKSTRGPPPKKTPGFDGMAQALELKTYTPVSSSWAITSSMTALAIAFLTPIALL